MATLVLAAVSAGAGLHTAVAGPETRPRAATPTATFGSYVWGIQTRTAPTWGWARRLRAPAVRVSPVAPVTPAPPVPARVRPVDGPITGAFGEMRGTGPHPGVDLDGETGDPIRAAAAGTVLATGELVGWGGYGIVVLMDHGAGIHTLYAHLSATSVQPGQVVAPATLIGAMGSTGFSTGSHLHFEVRHDGRPIDPLAWLATPAS